MATATTEVADEQVTDPKLVKPKLTEMDANASYVRGPGAVPKDRERKIGHRRVDEKTGTVTYKKKPTSELMAAIQLGIGQSVGGLSSKPERDLLMQDFGVVQSVFFPSEGSNITPAHHLSDYKFKTYAALAFRYFRELFNIRPDDFMLSLCDDAMVELSNPGAGGSIFYISSDDEFIIKTAQHKEAGFLQKLLPGYYMNLNQNPRTLLPKFYGLYCYQAVGLTYRDKNLGSRGSKDFLGFDLFQCGGKNIRFVVMNNMLPSTVKIHEKYDLKGSTYKRKASKSERAKSSPTWKDLDFVEKNPEGLLLEKETYDALVKTLQRDCRVLESFKIMDYSLLMGIHNLDQAKRDTALAENKSQSTDTAGTSSGGIPVPGSTGVEPADGKPKGLSRGKSVRTKVTQFNTPMESIQAEVNNTTEFDDEDIPPGGIPAKNGKGERLLLYLGVIDILQCYRMRKKMEHTFKSMITDGDTVSVTRPSFYAERFLRFFTATVFKKAPSPLKHSPSKKKPGDQIPGTMGGRPDLLIGSTTPPPPFSEVAGAKPRGNSTPSPRGSLRTDSERSEGRGHFQTIQQQEDSSLRNSLRGIPTPHRHSPLSVSESTPTYTDFTEGTPSYTASSPSCCSDVLDSTVPNLPLEKDCEVPSLENSPSKATTTMGAVGSNADASYNTESSAGGPSHGDTAGITTHNVATDGGVTVRSSVVSRSEERFSSNSQSVTLTSHKVVHQNGQSGNIDSGNYGNQVTVGGERVTIVLPSPDGDTDLSGGEPRISVTSQQSANTSFSTQTGSVDSQYSESIVSASTERSRATSRTDSTDGSWSNTEMNKMTYNVTETESHDVTEVVHELDESTDGYLETHL